MRSGAEWIQLSYARHVLSRFALICVALVSCTKPQFREVSCDNGTDDDVDGLTDCQDPDCRDLTTLCETTSARCRDGLDTDRNGRSDCEDASCREAGFCQNEVVDYCNVLEGTGCPVGYACYSTLGFERYECVVPSELDVRGPGDACLSELLPTGGCRPGSYCRGLICASGCRTDRDCPTDSVCIQDSGSDNGSCTAPCSYSLPSPSCAVGTECGPLQAVDVIDPRDRHLALSACLAERAFIYGPRGEGETCDADLGEHCADGLLCLANWRNQLTCRRACLGFIGDTEFGECPAGQRCEPIFPTHPNVNPEELVQGYCREDT